MPSGSRAADVNRTGSGAVPDRGSAAICTVGGWLAGGPSTTIVTSAVSNAPSRSVAVTVAVYVPGSRYVCDTFRPNCDPASSPKSHR